MNTAVGLAPFLGAIILHWTYTSGQLAEDANNNFYLWALGVFIGAAWAFYTLSGEQD